MRDRRFIVCVMAVSLLLAGCGKKNAKVTPDTAPAPPPTQAAAPPPPTSPPPAPTMSAPEPDPLSGDIESVNRYVREKGLLADVLFDYDRDELRQDARRQLENNARFIKEYPQFKIALEGHADERGTVEYNLALGHKRANNARTFLDTMGVEEGLLQATSYGKERPVCTDTNEGCWQRNRRVHFEIVGRIE